MTCVLLYRNFYARAEPEITDRRVKVLKYILLERSNQCFLLNYTTKYHVHKRNSSRIGGALPPSAPPSLHPCFYPHISVYSPDGMVIDRIIA